MHYNTTYYAYHESKCNTAWANQRPLQGNISYIALKPGQYLDIARDEGNI